MSRLCVSDLMHSCASATILAHSTLRDAAEQVLTTGLEALPVVDETGRFVGLVAQAALIRALLVCGSSDTTVDEIVSRHVESARSTAPLDSILPLFRSAGITMIPIVDENSQPVGLIHRRDVIRYLLEESPAPETTAERGPVRRPHFMKDQSKSRQR